MRFAMLSLDHWYNALPFIDSLKTIPGASLVGIAHTVAEQGEPIARKEGVPFTLDYRELLQRPDVDAVGIFASTDRLKSLTIEAARAGKHIVAIKPMAMNLAEAEQVVTAVEEAGVVYLPNDASYRLAALPNQIKRWIEEGRIGEPLNVFFAGRASVPARWQGDGARGWWTDPARTVGGGWIDHAIYQIDWLRYILQTEFTAATGFVGNLKYKDLGSLEDYGIGTFTTRRGTVITIEDTWTQPSAGLQQLYQIIGTAGAIMVDTAAGQMRVTGKFESLPDQWISLAPNLSRVPLAQHLMECVRDGKQPIATVRDARTNLAICLAFYEAATNKAPVQIN